jgi:hypothetical protein
MAALDAMYEKASIIQDVERFLLPALLKLLNIKAEELFPIWLHLLIPASLLAALDESKDEQSHSGTRTANTPTPSLAMGGGQASPEVPQAGALPVAENAKTGDMLAEDVPSQEMMLETWDDVLRDASTTVYKKTAKIHALEAKDNGILTVMQGPIETQKTYEQGDFILCGADGERYTTRGLDFAARYDSNKPQAATDSALAAEGFHLYGPNAKATNRIWALSLTSEQVKTYVPAGQFLASWGLPVSKSVLFWLVFLSRGTHVFRSAS